jgi:hypothetical protein
MTKLEEAIANAATAMSREARVELANRLLADLNDDEQKLIDTVWAAEIARRVKEIDAGEELLDGDEVMREARKLVRK